MKDLKDRGKHLCKSLPVIAFMLAGILALNTICGGSVSFAAIDIAVAIIIGLYISHMKSVEQYNTVKFQDAFDYMEQFSFAFLRKGQIGEALNETKELFCDGKMRETLDGAISFLAEEYDMEGRRKALSYIEKEYPTALIVKLHDYIIRAESYGGDIRRAISILKKEQCAKKLSIWEFAKELKVKRKNCILSCAAGGIISATMTFLAPDREALSGNIVYQAGLLFFCVMSCLVIALSYKKTVVDLLADKRMYSDEEIRDKLKRYISGKVFLSKIMLKKVIGQEMRFAFTEWILSVTLLLETHNVEGAIEESLETSPYCMKPFLMEFVDKVHENPGEVTPYVGFLEDFSFPEVRSSMRLLYSLSIGTVESVEEAITHLIEQNSNSLKSLENEKKDLRLAGLNMLFMLPVVITSVKLITDMSVILLCFISRI
ncbi:MAG: hypothetical protein IJT81_07930 [Lachnospiraceae bacterium]|nr:hypothetical protein [Lachnospiraceae bacterium]